MNKLFFILSFIIHIALFSVLFLTNNKETKINKKFLVLGAHSKIPSYAIFKGSQNKKTTDWFAKRKNDIKAIEQKKAAIKKAKQIQAQKTAEQKRLTIKKTAAITKNKKLTAKKIKTNKVKSLKKTKNNKIKQLEPVAENINTKKQKLNDIKKNLHFNMLGETNPQIRVLKKSIQKEVSRLWKPPIGVPKGTECTIEFAINKNGNVQNFKITKKSNILIYDLSILRVARQFKFDKFAWGKKVSIDFRQ